MAPAKKKAVGNGAQKSTPKKNKTPKKAEEGSKLGLLTGIVVEHCTSWRVFKKKAAECVTALSTAFDLEGQIEAKFNPRGKPKRGSFEIYLVDESGGETPIWSGLKRGPPRREKFPDHQILVKEAEKHV